MSLNEKIFREYDIRGIAETDLPDAVVEDIGKAIGTFLVERGGKRLTIGRDCRLSSERIFARLSAAIQSTGLAVVDIGLVPTPLLYFSVYELKTDGGVMITGSHNPSEHNGFKICIGKSTVHGEDIQTLKHTVMSKRYARGTGSCTQADVIQPYLDFVTKNVTVKKPLKVVVDSGNGMGGSVAPTLYRRLGCEVIELYSELDGRFPNHHPDPTVPANLAALVKRVKETGAVAGIGFDGDADRIGAVDECGRILFGDELLALYARSILQTHPGATVISEVKASHRLFQDISAHGGRPIMWKTGHSLIKAKMKEESALLAGEMSGHMFFNDKYFGYDDAIYSGARLLEILAETGKTPSQLLAGIPDSFSTPEIRVECADEYKFQVVDRAKAWFREAGHKVVDIDGARLEFGDGWGLVRASNTQPVLVYRFEATSQTRLDEIQKLMETTVLREIEASKKAS